MEFQEFYATQASRYDELVSAEDVDGNLGRALHTVLAGVSSLVEIGAGTGRVTRIAAPFVDRIVATEPVAGMLGEAIAQGGAADDVSFARAAASALPFESGSFDAAIAGWVFGHQREWAPDRWRDSIDGFLAECDRVTNTGRIVIIETLGTGFDTPHPPPHLVEYYEWLEDERGFERMWIRTDYEFESVDAAAAITGDFFGPEFATNVRVNSWRRVPECTGIWTRG